MVSKHHSNIPWDSLPTLSIEDWIKIEKKKRANRLSRLYRKRLKKKKETATLPQDPTHPWAGKGSTIIEESE